jgi:aerobic C4-dicarboxylate transport protein
VHRLLSEGLTPTNLIGNGVATIVVAKWENSLDEKRLQQVLDREINPAGLTEPAPA